jgi:hypothetical protein
MLAQVVLYFYYMKIKYFLILFLFIACLVRIKPVQAIVTTDGIDPKKIQVQEKKAEVLEKKEQVQEKKAELTQKMQQTRAKILEKHANRLQNRFLNIYYPRLEKLIAKFQDRLNLMAENGKDITAAQGKLDEASDKLTEAKVYADQCVSEFKNIDPDKYESQRELALAAKETAQKARAAFKESRDLLKQVLSLAKKAQ